MVPINDRSPDRAPAYWIATAAAAIALAVSSVGDGVVSVLIPLSISVVAFSSCALRPHARGSQPLKVA